MSIGSAAPRITKTPLKLNPGRRAPGQITRNVLAQVERPAGTRVTRVSLSDSYRGFFVVF